MLKKLKLFIDPNQNTWKVTLRYRKINVNSSFEKLNQIQHDVKKKLPLKFVMTGEVCQVLELRVRVQSSKNKNEKKTGVNFINGLRSAFTLVDPKSIKNTVKSSVLRFRDLQA